MLGADQVTWRFPSPAVNIVAGGNGSGKSLLCAAILAAAHPLRTEGLRRGLAEAGLDQVTIVGQCGPARREWTLDVRSGSVSWRPSSAAEEQQQRTSLSVLFEREESAPPLLPHLVLNGQWPIPDAASIAWAGQMLSVPLERELAAWEKRHDLLTGNMPGTISLAAAQADLDAHARIMANVSESRRTLDEHEARARILGDELTDVDLRAHIAQAEEQELGSKIELAERAISLESWANELRSTWRATEGARTRFAMSQERLEQLQTELRGLPEQPTERAHEYARLSLQRDEVAQRLAEVKLSRAEREAEIARLLEMQFQSRDDSWADRENELSAKREQAAQIERELKDLSRKRIDLLRQREGCLRVKQEKFREMSQFGDADWRALDQFLVGNSDGDARVRQERERLDGELEALNRRLADEFAGFERLGAGTSQAIEKLFAARSLAASFESELAQLKDELANEDRRQLRTGLSFGLAAAGAVGAGLPAGYFLGVDVGFFGAVVGGGVGYGVAQALMPSRKREHAEHVRQIERIQKAHRDAVKERETLEHEIAPLDHFLSPEGALNQWNEYRALHERAAQLQSDIKNRTTESADAPLPGLLRKLEAEEVRRKVADYRDLETQIVHTDRLLHAFDGPDGDAARMRALEAALQQLQEELRESERRVAQERADEQTLFAKSQADLERAEMALSALSADDVTAKLDAVTRALEQLDQSTGGVFSRYGAATVLMMLDERDRLLADARESKQLLSQAHPLNELAARAELVETELAQVTERLQELDPLYATLGSRAEGLTKYRTQLDALRAEVEANRARARDVETELADLNLDDLRRHVAALPGQHDLDAELLAHQVRVAELERSVTAASKMCDTLRAELSETKDTAPSRVMSQLKAAVFEAIGERIVSADLSGGEWVVEFEDGQRRQLATLPRGLSELVTLCLNAGLLTCTLRAEDAPIIWDDVFSQLDDHHLSIARKIVDQLAHRRQVILLTRDSRIRPWGQAVEVLVGRHELDPQAN